MEKRPSANFNRQLPQGRLFLRDLSFSRETGEEEVANLFRSDDPYSWHHIARSDSNFHFDFSQRDKYVDLMAHRHAEKLQRQYEIEGNAVADFMEQRW